GAHGRRMPVDVHAARGRPVAPPAGRGSRVARHRGPGRGPGRSLHRTDQRGRLMNVATAYLEEARSETLRYLRNPGFLLPIILFPATFYLMFGVALSSNTAPEAARYLLASYSTFGVMAPGLFGFGVSLALERDSGLLTLKRALPMPPGAYLLGKMLMAVLVAGAVGLLLLVLAVFPGGVALDASQWLSLLAVDMLGVLPF